MAFRVREVWPNSEEGYPDDNSVNIPIAMDYQSHIMDYDGDYPEAPSMTPDQSTGTTSTHNSDPHNYDLSNHLQPQRTYISTQHWTSEYPYPVNEHPILDHVPPEQQFIQDGDHGMFQEPLSYHHPTDNSISLVSSSTDFQVSNTRLDSNQYHVVRHIPSWSTTLQTSNWMVEGEDTKSARITSIPKVSSSKDMSHSVPGKTDNNFKITCNTCNKTFSRTADLKRHTDALHASKTFSCGCCEPKILFKRKDKLLKHKRKIHHYPIGSDGSPLKECKHKDCLDSPNKVLFCTARKLEQHMLESHSTVEVTGAPGSLNSPRIQDPNTLFSKAREITNPAISGHSSTPAKRLRHEESSSISGKRPRVDKNGEYIEETLHNGKLVEEPQEYDQVNLTSGHQNNGTDNGYAKNSNVMELLKPTSRSSDLLLISQLHSGRTRSASLQTLVDQLRELDISFNLANRSMKIQGNDYDPANINNSEVGTLLRRYWTEHNDAERNDLSKEPVCLRGSVRDVSSMRRNPTVKTFAMRNYHDEAFLNVWHHHILRELPSILPSSVGKNYAATLVRKGESESTSQVVIQIQCPKLPSQTLKDYLRNRILKVAKGKVPEFSIKIEFLSGSLALLSGGAMTSEEEEEGEDYPYFKLYWEKPGMGAPIGLECTDQVSATLGCYVHVDGRLYILAVKHFIPRSHKRLMSGEEPTLIVASPPRLEVNETREVIEQILREIDNEVRQTWIRITGQECLDFQEALQELPEPVYHLLKKLEAVNNDLHALGGRANDFRLGEVVHQSASPTQRNQSRPSAPKHHMDWALCRVDGSRQGLNRHRYQYDKASNQIDFTSGDVDMFGAGRLCVETGSVRPGEEVHFVGQSSGLQHGKISPAMSLVSIHGVETHEWTMVVESQQTGGPDFRGDSGASILQDRDNKLVGHLWGCVKSSLVVFAPIAAIFDDIRQKFGTQNVCLPPAPEDHQPVAQVVHEMCREVTTEQQKTPRKFNWSKIKIRELPHSSLAVSDSLKAQEKITPTPKDPAKHQVQENKLSLQFILFPPPPFSTRKSNTFPLNKHLHLEQTKARRNGAPRIAMNVHLADGKGGYALTKGDISSLRRQHALPPPKRDASTRKHNTFPLWKPLKWEGFELPDVEHPWPSGALNVKTLGPISVS